ncbi:hypothetical protein Rxycam_02738 [Rubrobacter xylanophilus DSM 9941]|uniref:DUF421 domain-containing protein n=1 Tax=Rubrobacter xylanophilus TaxID=49319 RepID=UPI001C63FB6E|nr:YetF domain-containing protein [Rubrobacter xylanophilus]QYJ16902.1 hypothetical protein Rxycam_02738 [Rubrobacter xylanophilus DSM 9941]
MDAVIRAAAIYLFLLVIFRTTGRRSLAQMTPFDLVLLLIISEATQQGLLGDDFSLTNSFLVVLTLVSLNLLLTALTHRFDAVDRWINDVPLVLIEDGDVLHERLRKARVDLEDVLEAARESQGLERLDQIKYAVLERSGGISIIPRRESGPGDRRQPV